MDARYHVRTQRIRECFLTDQHAANLRWTIPSKRSHRSTGISSKLVVTNLYDEHIHCNLAFTFSPTLSIGTWSSHTKIKKRRVQLLKRGNKYTWLLHLLQSDKAIQPLVSTTNETLKNPDRERHSAHAKHTHTHTHKQKHRHTDTHTHIHTQTHTHSAHASTSTHATDCSRLRASEHEKVSRLLHSLVVTFKDLSSIKQLKRVGA